MIESYVTRLNIFKYLRLVCDVCVYYLADLQDGVNKLIDFQVRIRAHCRRQKVRPKSSVQWQW